VRFAGKGGFYLFLIDPLLPVAGRRVSLDHADRTVVPPQRDRWCRARGGRARGAVAATHGDHDAVDTVHGRHAGRAADQPHLGGAVRLPGVHAGAAGAHHAVGGERRGGDARPAHRRRVVERRVGHPAEAELADIPADA